jgi:hypothetical protein
MKRVEDLYGFPVFHNEEEKRYEILEFPHFPQDTKQSKQLYFQLEKNNLNRRCIQFPIQFNITQRIVEIQYENIEYFNLKDIFDVVEKDKNRFINTDTFFKLELVYENKTSILSILYYTICDNGNTTIHNIDDLLNFIFIKYDTKKFTKKFIKPRMKKYGNIPNDIEHIPLLPLLWLDYDENYNIIYFNHFKLIDDDKNLPF